MVAIKEARATGANRDPAGAGPAPARRARTRSADVERELLAAAEAVLVREGPGGLTVRAVAAEAGTAPMGVYNRLGGKDGLVAALLIRVQVVAPVRYLPVVDGDDGGKAVVVRAAGLDRRAVHLVFEDGH